MINLNNDSRSEINETTNDSDDIHSSTESVIKKSASGTRKNASAAEGQAKSQKTKEVKAKAAQQKTSQQKKAQQTRTGQARAADAEKLLKADHRKVEELFESYQDTEDADEKREIAQNICKELIIHAQLEEEVFYPECYAHGVEEDALGEAQVEHDTAKIIIADLLADTPEDEYYDSKVKVLEEYIKHHVGEEEQARSGIFAKARKAGVDMDELGERIQARKEELLEDMGDDAEDLSPPEPYTLHALIQTEETFKSGQDYRAQDYRGQDDRSRRHRDDDDEAYESSRGAQRYGRSHEDSEDEDDDDRYAYGRGDSYDRSGFYQSGEAEYGTAGRTAARSTGRRADYSEEYGRETRSGQMRSGQPGGGQSRSGQSRGGQSQQYGQSQYPSSQRATSQRGSQGRDDDRSERYARDDDDAYGAGRQYGDRSVRARKHNDDDWDMYGQPMHSRGRLQHNNDRYGSAQSGSGQSRHQSATGGKSKSQGNRGRGSR